MRIKNRISNYNFISLVRTFRLGWQQENHPIEIWLLKVFEQKLNYIYQNPVESGFVTNPIDWKYSSARDRFELI